MASVTITVPDDLVPRLLAALTANHPDVDVTDLNPGPAAKRLLAAILREELVTYEEHVALTQGLDAAMDAARLASIAARAAALDESTGVV